MICYKGRLSVFLVHARDIIYNSVFTEATYLGHIWHLVWICVLCMHGKRLYIIANLEMQKDTKQNTIKQQLMVMKETHIN